MGDFRIIADSSCELPAEYMDDGRFTLVPFNLEVGGVDICDDDTLDVYDLINRIASSPTCPKSACPSPETFVEKIKESDAKNIYIITISSQLSGCYNSAVLAKSLYEEEHDDKNICVIDSRSASCGESLLALKVYDFEAQDLPFEEIEASLNQFRDDMNTYVVLDNLETLRKNGRLSKIGAIAATTLHIKPLLMAVMGEIVAVEKAIGLKKAWVAMAKRIAREASALSPEHCKRMVITHCNNLAGAEKVRDMIAATTQFKDFIIMQTKGLSTLYANDGGIIISY